MTSLSAVQECYSNENTLYVDLYFTVNMLVYGSYIRLAESQVENREIYILHGHIL